MSISCEHSVDVSCSPEQAFALLDDLPRTSEWLGPCTAIEKLTAEPNAVGQKMKYHYEQGGQKGVMDGTILARVPNEKLTCEYYDKMMQVVVDFNVSRLPSGSRLKHVITITPKTFFSKLMTPLIRMSLPKQTHQAMAALKSILESGKS